MGQVQSVDDLSESDEQIQDVGDSEIDSTNQNEPKAKTKAGKGEKSTGTKIKTQGDTSKCTPTLPTSVDNTTMSRSERQQRNFELQQQQQRARKLSTVSQSRNIQLLSMRPRTERDSYADELKSRRRSSLINLILGAPSSGPRFSDDLCSINSRLSNFGIEFFPEAAVAAYYPMGGSSFLAGSGSRTSFAPSLASTWRLEEAIQRRPPPPPPPDGPKRAVESLEQVLRGATAAAAASTNSSMEPNNMTNQRYRRRSSIGSIAEHNQQGQLQRKQLASGFEAMDKLRAGCKSALPNDAGKPVAVDSDKAPSVVTNEPSGGAETVSSKASSQDNLAKLKHPTYLRKPSLASTLASIDLTSSFEQADRYFQANLVASNDSELTASNTKKDLPYFYGSSSKQHQLRHLHAQQQQAANGDMIINGGDFSSRIANGRINQSGRVLRRSGSELSLYSTSSGLSCRDANGYPRASVVGCSPPSSTNKGPADNNDYSQKRAIDPMKETKLIIILQVCLPFILAGFGNMSAGLALGKISQWEAFVKVPAFIVLLPPLVGLKGNIEMTLASRLSTLSNLNLLDTKSRRQRAYISNLILIVSQAMGLSVFAAFVAILCEMSLGGGAHAITGEPKLLSESSSTSPSNDVGNDPSIAIHVLLVLASALATTVILSIVSSIVMSLAVIFANWIQVNPDNLSTLVAALYGDVSCVVIYGFISNWIFLAFKEQSQLFWPLGIVITVVMIWPPLLFTSYKLKETHSIALASIPPMLTSILISMGSGKLLTANEYIITMVICIFI